jgi:hypothetical protein
MPSTSFSWGRTVRAHVSRTQGTRINFDVRRCFFAPICVGDQSVHQSHFFVVVFFNKVAQRLLFTGQIYGMLCNTLCLEDKTRQTVPTAPCEENQRSSLVRMRFFHSYI